MDFPLKPSFGTRNLDTAPQCASFLGTFASLKSSCCQSFANDGRECPNVRWEIRPMFFFICVVPYICCQRITGFGCQISSLLLVAFKFLVRITWFIMVYLWPTWYPNMSPAPGLSMTHLMIFKYGRLWLHLYRVPRAVVCWSCRGCRLLGYPQRMLTPETVPRSFPGGFSKMANFPFVNGTWYLNSYSRGLLIPTPCFDPRRACSTSCGLGAASAPCGALGVAGGVQVEGWWPIFSGHLKGCNMVFFHLKSWYLYT